MTNAPVAVEKDKAANLPADANKEVKKEEAGATATATSDKK